MIGYLSNNTHTLLLYYFCSSCCISFPKIHSFDLASSLPTHSCGEEEVSSKYLLNDACNDCFDVHMSNLFVPKRETRLPILQ
jgi:hypothetical protein